MGRPKTGGEKVTLRCNSVVMAQVREKLTLAYTGKLQYGALSRLVEAMLRMWLRGEIQFDPIVLDDLDALELHSVLPPEELREQLTGITDAHLGRSTPGAN